MKIIVNNASHLCKCCRCGSKLEVSPSDIKNKSFSGRDCELAERYYFVCPCCEAKNDVDLQTFYTFEPYVDKNAIIL